MLAGKGAPIPIARARRRKRSGNTISRALGWWLIEEILGGRVTPPEASAVNRLMHTLLQLGPAPEEDERALQEVALRGLLMQASRHAAKRSGAGPPRSSTRKRSPSSAAGRPYSKATLTTASSHCDSGIESETRATCPRSVTKRTVSEAISA